MLTALIVAALSSAAAPAFQLKGGELVLPGPVTFAEGSDKGDPCK